MYSDEIETILTDNKNLLGCYASNQLPTTPSSFPKLLIINTGTSDTAGEHWVALIMNRKRCYQLMFSNFGISFIGMGSLHPFNWSRKGVYRYSLSACRLKSV